MSWSVSYVAAGKSAAIEHARRAHLPDLVRLIIIDGIRQGDFPDDSLISVEGNGHQAEGRSSYNVTSCQLTVKPIIVTPLR
jgi:hypothetical protein